MPICKINKKKHYTGNEPSPKGLGYCASSEKEGKIMEGRDGNLWIKSNGKWIKHVNKEDLEEQIHEKLREILDRKLYKWWQNLAQGNIIVIYSNGKHKLCKSSMKTFKAQLNDINQKWKDFEENKDVKAVIWSAQSTDIIGSFIDYLIKHTSKNKLEQIIKMKDLPSFLLDNYKKYFEKYEYNGKKDYTLKSYF